MNCQVSCKNNSSNVFIFIKKKRKSDYINRDFYKYNLKKQFQILAKRRLSKVSLLITYRIIKSTYGIIVILL